MRRIRRVKILATLGPASSEEQTIEDLARAGADIFRINMSHASHDVLKQFVARIRNVEERLNHPLGVLVDLQGPKLRIGTFEGGAVQLAAGESFTLDSSTTPGSKTRVHLPHPEILEAVGVGDRLLLDDGKIELRAIKVGSGAIETTVVHGGKLSDKKGVSLPDTLLAVGALTEKDMSDLHQALEVEADWIALSFVQRPEDIIDVRKIVQGRAGVMAKIEKPQAVERLEEIIKLCDAFMIARGDLGVELPLETVPGLQKRMIRIARRFGKPVVVATQMLESMITSPVPTRAEVSDVSIAVFEGADAIMLSAESAAGQYPIEAVSMMNRIAEEVESDPTYRAVIQAQRAEPEATGADAIALAARDIGETLDLSAIVCWTMSGSTALRVARERPKSVTIALTPKIATGRRLALLWGVHCVVTQDARDLDDMVSRACRFAFKDGFAKPGQRIIVVAGVPLGTPGATNMLRIAFVGADSAEV
jgi:pyruvate kinase